MNNMIKLVQPDNAPNFCFEIIGQREYRLVVDNEQKGFWSYGKRLDQLQWPKETDLDFVHLSQFIQTDWDYPGVARSFGWSGGDLQISEAYQYLLDNVGAVAEDPGYFN